MMNASRPKAGVACADASKPPASTDLDPSRWIRLSEAAERLGRNPQHLARQCRQRLVKRGDAVKAIDPAGRTRWWLKRDHHPALRIDADPAADITSNLSAFSRHQICKAYDRVAVVRAYRKARASIPRPISRWIEHFIVQQRRRFPKLKMTYGTIRRWDGIYQSEADLVKLIDTRGGNQTAGACGEAWAYFKSVFLDQNQPTLKDCWRRTREHAKAQGWRWCSYEACRRQLDQRIPPAERALHRRPRDYRNSFEPYIEQDPDRHAPGTCWVGDHRQLDVHCYFGKRLIRPWITAWQDWRSRRITGWVLSDQPNSSTILAAFRMGMLGEANFGGPDQVHVDNGKDYDAAVFDGRTKKERKHAITNRLCLVESEGAGLFGQLQIGISFSLPYNPRGKGRLERWFGTMAQQFDKHWPTYAGSNPTERPERLASILKQPDLVPTFEQVEVSLANWIATYNTNADHAIEDLTLDGQRVSPDAMMTRCPRRRVLADPSVLDLLLAKWPKPVRVHRNGVSVRIKGKAIRYGQFDPTLRQFIGTERVRVAYDPHDIRTIRVFDKVWRYLCTVTMNGYRLNGQAVTESDVGDLLAQQRRVKQAAKTAHQGWQHQVLSFSNRLEDQVQQRLDPLADETPVQVARTALDGASKDVQKHEVCPASEAKDQQPTPDILDLIDSARGHLDTGVPHDNPPDDPLPSLEHLDFMAPDTSHAQGGAS